MLFEAEPEHVAALDSLSLVRLMKRLMLAECRLAGIPLRSASAPLQITVADGGEDGRIEWTGGSPSTAYFPSRFTILQSKAQDLAPSEIKAETHKKTKGRPPALSDALTEVLTRGGAYVVFCKKPFTTTKRKKLVKAIAEGIEEVGSDPKKASAIEVYDANLIAEWVNSHPPVALWLASQRLGRPLQGFQTHESWGRSPEIASVPWQVSGSPRFAPVNVRVEDRADPSRSSWTHDQAAAAVREHLSKDGAIVRVAGPSGFGKTRFVYELLGASGTVADQVDTASVMFADGAISGDEAVKLAMEIADVGLAAILVIDECTVELHNKLVQMVQRAGSCLRLITLDIEIGILQAKDTLSLRLEKAADDHIQQIAKGIAPALSDADSRFIADLAEGFPRVAVLAAQHDAAGRQTINSVEQVLGRVVWGAKVQVPDAEKALGIASLFEWIGIQGRVESQVAYVATQLANMTPAIFVEHLLSFRSRGIISQRGDFAQVGPVPLAARLGLKRLSTITADRLVQFFDDAPDELKASLLKRLKWMDTSPVSRAFAQRLLEPTALGNFAALNTDFGAKCLDRLVHIDPETVSAIVERVFGSLSLDELKAARDGRRYLVWTLEKLVFRKESFDRAATLLLKLAVAENEEKIGNNATAQFKQLYQLHLSGTEADPAARLLVLDEGLKSSDLRERKICVEALGTMLDTGHFTRGGGAEQIGSAERLEDWRPKTYGEIWDFYRAAVTRLTAIVTGNDPLAKSAKELLGQHVRGLIGALPLQDCKAMITAVSDQTGLWPESIRGVSQWLYFDSMEAPKEIASSVRAYFDSLMPADPIDAVDLYTSGWHADFHDPDSVYDASPGAKHDFEYSVRKATALGADIAADPALLIRAVSRFACSDAKSIFPFARQLAISVSDPKALFFNAIQVAESSTVEPNRAFFSGLISGADSQNQSLARSLVRAALRSPRLKAHAISLIGAGHLRREDIALVVDLLRSKDVQPWQCANLSYGRGLDHLASADFLPLLEELENHGADGLWTILDVVGMYLYGGKQPDKALVTLLKRVLINRVLLERVRNNVDGYHLEQMVVLLAKLRDIPVTYAKQLTQRLMSICERRADRVFYELDSSVRKALDALMGIHPDQVWAVISSNIISPSWHVRFYARKLLESRSHDDHLSRGIAFNVPLELILQWVRQEPQHPAALAVDWLPVAVKDQDGSLKWSREVEEYIREFGGIPDVLHALSARMHPTSWWGSLAPHLEPLIPLLETWRTHPNPAVRGWASRTIDALRKEIREEAKRSEEDVVRYS